jgi:hypothetical protein
MSFPRGLGEIMLFGGKSRSEFKNKVPFLHLLNGIFPHSIF